MPKRGLLHHVRRNCNPDVPSADGRFLEIATKPLPRLCPKGALCALGLFGGDKLTEHSSIVTRNVCLLKQVNESVTCPLRPIHPPLGVLHATNPEGERGCTRAGAARNRSSRSSRRRGAGAKLADRWRRHGISEQTVHRWKAKFGGREVNDTRRLKQLGDENRRVQYLVADLTLDNQALKAIAAKDW